LTPCFEAKFGWETDESKALHNSLLGSSVVLGNLVGALMGGILMRIGRRRSYLIICCIGIIGNLTTIYIDSFAIVIIGRIIYGFASGLFSAISPKFLEDAIPSHNFAVGVAGL